MSRFTLNARDKLEVQKIADALPDDELQQVAAEADDWMNRNHVNPLMMAAQNFLQQNYGSAAVSMLDSDDDWHIRFDELLRDLMVDTGKRERGIHVLINKVA